MNLIKEKRNIRIIKKYNPFFYNLMKAGIIDRLTAVRSEDLVDLNNVPYVMAKKINMISDMQIECIDKDDNLSFCFVKRGNDKLLDNLYTPKKEIIIEEQKEESNIEKSEAVNIDIIEEEPLQEDNVELIDENLTDENNICEEYNTDLVEKVLEDPQIATDNNEILNNDQDQEDTFIEDIENLQSKNESEDFENEEIIEESNSTSDVVDSLNDEEKIKQNIYTLNQDKIIKISIADTKQYNGKNKKKKKH